MSPNLDSPVQTQMAVAVFNSPLSGEYYGNKAREGKLARRRRVFVQTETGCVLGMELDRSDNAHTVKRRLQIALNVPTEESSLTFGDMVLKNDLSAIRNDSPLLLTRNLLHRSSSTPCLSPTGREVQQRDQSGPIEILGHSKCFARTKQLVKEIVKGMKNGVDPIPVHGGLGGAYYFRNSRGESVAIVKPTDEEPFAPNNPKGFVGKALGQPGLKRSVRVGETGFRKVAAYLLDYDHFANPCNKKLVSKIASFQQFVRHDFDASDYGTSSFPVSAVHRIGILDIRIFNTDRHGGNLLVRKLDGVEEKLEYIENLDPIRDSEMLRSELPMIREACLRVLVLCTIFLKEAAPFGLCLTEIGEMMSRDFRGGEEEPSELEIACIEAKKLIAEREVLSPKTEAGNAEFQFDIDCEEPEFELTPKSDDLLTKSACHFGFFGGSGRCPLSKLEEGIEEEEESRGEEVENGFGGLPLREKFPDVLKLSMSFKDTSLGEKNQKYLKFPGAKPQHGYLASSSSGYRSANEQLPTSASFVKLADMNEEEWLLFLEKFQEFLYSAFSKQKSATLDQRQRQRLGTSCQF
ncbi:phosphoinositide 4-kinase gamma 7 [Actinidia rufa]|uniref:1-phosphatidylinositol 4-kinase n=1 Tax=Actinidia rufa TaxID=165716 RepID=A0A7J0H6G0_9ERIC|nr:phosphoinositide 4-kinase gamma 7 [Actinidia rufa]